jgi:hypothetical protein
METTPHQTEQSTNVPDPRRYYAYTSNGDWMELGGEPDPYGGPDGYRGQPPSVYVIVCDAKDDDELYELADGGQGEVLAQVFMDVAAGKVRFLEPRSEGQA